jgi:hypothetical protein
MSSDQNIRCDVCGQEFYSFDALKEHIRSETEDKKHKDHKSYQLRHSFLLDPNSMVLFYYPNRT